MKNSLGLVDDGDAASLIEEIEAAFGIEFQNGELARAVGARNVAALSQRHGAVRAREVWSSLVLIARECAPDAKTIDRETILIG